MAAPIYSTAAINILRGSVAQLVEQRPEEPCVTGSSPVGATIKQPISMGCFLIRDQEDFPGV